MLFGLDFETIITTVYHTPISYIIFYYFILFTLSSIVKKVMQIEVDSKADFGIFKIDRNSVPTLLLLAWFGLTYKFISSFNVFESSVLTSLVCVLAFVMLLIFLKEIQRLIQTKAAISSMQKQGRDIQTEQAKSRSEYYRRRTYDDYSSLLMSFLLVLFCLIFSYLEFAYLTTISVAGLMVAYVAIVLWEKIFTLHKDLKEL